MNRRSFFTALASPAVAPLIPKAKALPAEPPKAKCGPPAHATGYTPYAISYTARPLYELSFTKPLVFFRDDS